MSAIVWITGASSGLGRQAALEFARRGYRVAATARRAEALESLAAESDDLLGDVVAYPGDVTDGAAMAEVVGAIEDDMGPIGIAVLNAGTFFPMTVDEFDPDALEKTLNVNVMGVARSLAPLLKRMIARGDGRIYPTASLSGYVGLPRASAYGLSKAGLINMAESLHLELKPKGVHFGVIVPGFVETPLTEKNDFPMPFLSPVERAAEALVDGVLGRKFEVGFPMRFVLLMKLVRMLPYGLAFPLLRWATRGRR